MIKIKGWKILRFSPILFFIIPVLFIFIVPALVDFEFIQQYARNSTDLFTLNGRVFIWIFALDEFTTFKYNHIFGYGFDGHFTSGSSLNWEFLFSSYHNSQRVHPHNTLLSALFDVGYLGVLIFIVLCVQISISISKIGTLNRNLSLTLFSIFLFIILISTTETFVGLYYLNTFTIFVSIAIFALIYLEKPFQSTSS
jgi:hypothetical protein